MNVHKDAPGAPKMTKKNFKLVQKEGDTYDLHIEMTGFDSLFAEIFAKNAMEKSTLVNCYDNEFGGELFRPLLGQAPDLARQASLFLRDNKENLMINNICFNKDGKTLLTMAYRQAHNSNKSFDEKNRPSL